VRARTDLGSDQRTAREHANRKRLVTGELPDSRTELVVANHSPRITAAGRRDYLLSAVNGKIIWQTWCDLPPGFCGAQGTRGRRPIEILKQLALPEAVESPDPP
jgi:hypothetical protein